MLIVFAGGNTGSCFSMNEITGELQRVKELDREETATFQLWIEARSSGVEGSAAFTSLTVEVSRFSYSVSCFVLWFSIAAALSSRF